MSFRTELSLYSRKGKRKYLNSYERKLFYQCTLPLPFERRIFSLLMYHTGARITEIHSLTMEHVDFENKSVILRTLKKKKKHHYRSIPLPDDLLSDLLIMKNRMSFDQIDHQIWRFSNRTARRIIKSVMHQANIYGAQACGRGLRHGFALACIERNIPLTQLQRWLGHSDIAMTSVYLNVSGLEERELASRLWDHL